MTTSLERSLHDAFEQQTNVPPPLGLAQGAITRYRRRRAIRIAATGALAVAVLAGAAAVALPERRAPAVEVAAPGAERMVITGVSSIGEFGKDGSPNALESLLLDRRTGKYLRVPYLRVDPSPDGLRAIVYKGDNSAAHPSRTGVLDIATGDVRWLELDTAYMGDAGWAPDGRRFLMVHRPRQGGGSFAIVDVTKLEVSWKPLPEADSISGLEWMPNGDEIAATLYGPERPEQARPVVGVRFFGLDGTVRRTIPANGEFPFENAFSADGSKLVVGAREWTGADPVTVLDAATGAVLSTLKLPSGVDDLLGWYDDEHLIVTHAVGPIEVEVQVIDLSGRPTITVQLPTKEFPRNIHVRSARGLTGPAAEHAF